MVLAVLLIGLAVAWANGANDNFKGVATLFGSGTATYRRALIWATVTTGLGSLTALLLAGRLLAAFTGKGLVPDEVVADPTFTLAVAFAAGATVLAATRFGFPISTTHALIGGLVGAGLVRSAAGIATDSLGRGFVLPLATSPLIAIALTAVLYPPLRLVRRRVGAPKDSCLCVGEEVAVVAAPGAATASVRASFPSLTVAHRDDCALRYSGRAARVSGATALDGAHFLSAGAVSFARGLNDTPKIAALLLAGSLVSPLLAITLVGVAIAAGGWLNAKRVAETMSHRITEMSPGQGLTANLVTAGLVIVASNLGVPVSTTHVSCGALFGIGAATRRGHWGTVTQVAAAWLITLPVAGLLGAGFAALTA